MKKIISLFAAVLFAGSMMAEVKTYTLTINKDNFTKVNGTGSGYVPYNGDHEFTATATDESGKTITVVIASNQVMVNGDSIQAQKSNGYLYNKTNLGSISSIAFDYAAGKLDKFKYSQVIGSEENPSSAVANGAYFKISAGSKGAANSKSIVITFTKDDAVVPVTGIALDITSKNIEVGESFQLTATISPNDATNKNVEWSTTSTKASVDENGVVTGLAEGSATIWAKSEADNTITASCNVTIGAAVPSEYVETAFDDIKSEDEVVITMKIDSLGNNAIFALNGSEATGSAPKADKVRLVETSIKPVVEGNIFVVSKVTGGYQFTLKSGAPTKVLYTLDDNNGIRVKDLPSSGTNSAVWNIDAGNKLYAKPGADSRYLCVYSSSDFRAYKNAPETEEYNKNVKDQTLKFYVKAIGGTPVVPTAIDETEAANQATKELREGQVLIIKGNKTYNILGQEIR